MLPASRSRAPSLLALGLLVACSPSGLVPPQVPPLLVPPAENALLFKGEGDGLQVYACQPKPTGMGFEWTLVAPEAQVVDAEGILLCKHYAGPTWEAPDGSKVTGEVTQKMVSPDPEAIPWLLLATTPSGEGMFAGVRTVQRLETSGGKPPANGCDAEHAGAESRVAYRATYYFYGGDP